MQYAEVSVNSPMAQRRTFTYSIPPGLEVEVGQAVWVPFGDRMLQGIVLELSQTSPIETRDIIDVIEPRPLLSLAQVSLARWLSEYYLAPIFEAIALMLPPGFERKAATFVQPTGKGLETSSVTEGQRQVFESVQKQGKTALHDLERAMGKTRAQAAVAHLVRVGLLARSYELAPVKVKAKVLPYLHLAVAPDQARQQSATLRKKRAGKQAALLDWLQGQPEAVSLADARQLTGATKATVDALAAKGLIEVRQTEVRREPFAYPGTAPPAPLPLTSAQEAAFNAIKEALRGPKPSQVFLLHGVTGSGKTEVYLQSLAEAVRLGKRGIVLVPEISLTPQTIERFVARFPNRVAIFHSQLTLGEQYDEWHRIRQGKSDVVIGPRSALFAQPNLGLIILDEEHEWTYKQPDKSPHYHARAAALKLAELTGAVVVLGSATPDVETFYRARRGDYHLVRLPERVVPCQGAPMPEVEVVDMRQELKTGNRSVFSRSLAQAMGRAIAAGEQVILLLNRRGAATSIQCGNCGFALRCKRCDMSLAYHAAENALVCHHCNYRAPLPPVCPRCYRPQLRFLGMGTQKLAQEAGQAFPGARQLRWDSDITRQGYSHDEILHRFRDHEADILIGTQVVAKGLDFPLVTLVGVVSADTSLNLPDFRAGERTFQLLSQVAGRAGRGAISGRVIIQSFSPEHYAIQAAARHDYASFYEREIDFRRQLHDPPFTQLARLIFSHTNDARCQKETERIRDLLAREKDAKGLSDLSLIGPAPAFIQRLRGRFRWQLVVRGANLSSFLSGTTFSSGWTVDIDPVSLI